MEIKQKMIDFLLNNANPSIVYRIKNEILNDIDPIYTEKLQKQIIAEPTIQLIVKAQKPNGWIGNGFHGASKNAGAFDNQEVGVKYLSEKGLLKSNKVLKKAINAFVSVPLTDLCYETKGRYYNEFELAAFGQNTIRCASIARAGYDDEIDIKPQLQLAVDSFNRVLEVDSIFDVSKPAKNGKIRVFNDREKWPCQYHLYMLAFSKLWKNDKNIKIVANSIKKLLRTDRKEFIGVGAAVWVGHYVGPLWQLLEGLIYERYEIDGKKYLRTDYIEWFARCGIIPYIKQLQDTVYEIQGSINNFGICEYPLFINKNWGPYFGQRLEIDWKSKIRKQCDNTFRALLILHYSGV